MKKVYILIFLIPLFSFQDSGNRDLTVVSDYFNLVFKKGDFVSIEKIVAKDAVYNQAEGLPYGGTYTGLNEWIKMFGKVQSYFEVHVAGGPTLYSNPNNSTVVANFRVRLTSRKTERTLEMPIAELFELKNGIITSVTPYYFDTKSIADFAKDGFGK